MSHLRLYESALNDVRYVYGKPIKFKSSTAKQEVLVKDVVAKDSK